MKYKLLALDVDGTLVGPDSIVPPETIDAVQQAKAAGMHVCIATGRSYCETIGVWRQLGLKSPADPMVLIGGALVAEPDTGRTLYQKCISSADACEYGQALTAAGYSAMGIVDVWRHGVDYLLIESRDVACARNWFSKMDANIRRVESFNHDPEMPPLLRINAVVEPAAGPELALRMARSFDKRLNVHSIYAPNYDVTVVEAFAAACSKWSALVYVAQGLRVAPSEIVAVGDDVNDLPMIRSAGLGVAMPWAKQIVKDQAKALAEPTLAEFIRNLLTVT